MPCNEVFASCICKQDEGHDGRHVCPCGGAWTPEGEVDTLPPAVPFGTFAWGPEDEALLDRAG